MKKQNRVVGLNILSTLILTGISMFTSPLFSRLLGTSGYGIMSTYTVWMNALAIAATLETGSTLVHARVNFPKEEQEAYQSAVMTLSMAFFLLFCCVVMVFAKPISGLLKLSYGLMALLLLQSFGSFGTNFLNTKLRYELKAGTNMILSLVVTVVSLSLSLVLVLAMTPENRYIGRILGNSLTYGTLGLAACGYILWKGRTYFHPVYWKFCLPLVVPLIFMNLSDLLLGHSDLVMVRSFLGDSPSGIYGLAYTFSGIMFTIFGALNKSWVPFFFDQMKDGQCDAVDAMSRNFLELFTILSMGFILLTREVYHIFASRDFWEGTNLIYVFVTSYYLNFLCTFPVNFEHFHTKVHAVSVVTIVSAVLNIGLNYLFIRGFGLPGAAVATMIAHTLQFTMHQCYSKFVIGKDYYPFPMKMLGAYILAFAAAVAVTVLFEKVWLIRWGVGAVLGLWELWRIRKRGVLL